MSDPIPAEALAHHIAILGKTGSGKSNAAKTLVEAALDRGERVCVLDPTGAWYGLRLTAKGKPSPYPVVIFGGQHADLQIGGAHGAAIAETVGTSSTPAVIDTRLMTVGDRTRFFTDFAETLLRKNRGPLTLVIDEAHLFAPQGRVADPQSGKMLHAANNLVSLGRSIGLRVVMLSQRPAKLHKDSLTQVETLVAMRLIAPQDRAAIDAWIGEWADPGQGREIVASLPSLPTGDAWVWSPELNVLHRAHFALARTFDSGKAPTGEEAGPTLAPLDLAEVTARLETVAAEVVANDPRTLKAEIARLKKEIAAPSPATVDEAAVRVAEQTAYQRGHDDGSAQVLDAMGKIAGDLAASVGAAKEACERSERLLSSFGTFTEAMAEAPRRVVPTEASAQRQPAPTPAPRQSQPSPAPAARQSDGNAALTGPQRQLLGVLAWWAAMGHSAPSRAQVAAVAGWKITSGHLKNVAGALKTSGLVDYPGQGQLAMTDAGRAAAPAPDMSISFHDQLRGTLTGPQRAVFDLLLCERRAMSREEITTALGWAQTSGHIKNVVGSMKTLEIVGYPGPGVVGLQDWVTG